MITLWMRSGPPPAGVGFAVRESQGTANAQPEPESWRAVMPVLSAMLVAAAPVLWWFAQRLDDGSDEPFGLLALAFALGIAWRDRHHIRSGTWNRVAGASLILLSVIGIGSVPPLLRAALVVAGTGTWFGLHRMPGVLGLIGLSLPLVASLEFYAAYPMRLAAAEGSVRLLELGGLAVARDGVNIELAGMVVGVDPACSGVRMLWFALVAAMALAAIHRVSWRMTLTGAALAVAWTIPANTFRATWLALEESGRFAGSWIGHGGIGLLCFGIILPFLSIWFSKRGPAPEVLIHSSEDPSLRTRTSRSSFPLRLLIFAAVLTPIMVWRAPGGAPTPARLAVPETFTFNGLTLPLQPLPPTRAEQAFAKSFPGLLSSHQWGTGQVIIRSTRTATRRLHPSRDCLRASGYKTSNAVTVSSRDGTEWSRFTATRDGIRRTVHERIVSETTGDSWTDVTAWYWSALRHPLNGPWRAETVISD
jgi:exosortase/archaeosortase family protein